jgi:uncharacterized protein
MGKKTAPDLPLCSPIPFSPGSNGEAAPRAPSRRDRQAEELFRRLVDDRSRALGVSRRQFIRSTAGTATALLVINQVYGCGSSGDFAVDAGSTFDDAMACEQLGGDEFIFDVQTHHVNPAGAWRDRSTVWPFFLASLPQGSCGEPDPVDCFDTNHYIREMFINSDTAIAALSAVPAAPEDDPLTAAEAAETARVVQMLAGTARVVTHGLVLADRGEAQLDGMQALVENHGVSAWKCYPQFGSWRLDEAAGLAFIERARELGVKIVCAHKGLSLFGLDPAYADPADMGVVAAMFPDTAFVAYHAGYEPGVTEGPYDPSSTRGIDTLIKALLDNGLGPNDNLYAELGTTWRDLITAGGDQAQHAIGKLLKHFGPDRILWGTDSIWYGSPQDQIAAFRAFEIRLELQAAHDYPALTPEARARILGLNAAALYGVDPDATVCAIDGDAVSARKAELDRPAPTLKGYGPQTRREFLAFLRERDGQPG